MDLATGIIKNVLYWGVFATGLLVAADVIIVSFCMMIYRGFKLPPKPTVAKIEVIPHTPRVCTEFNGMNYNSEFMQGFLKERFMLYNQNLICGSITCDICLCIDPFYL